MKKHVELPLVSPIYSTYHNQGTATAILKNNPTIRNWYLNQIMMLTCSRKFLNGFTSPELEIEDSTWKANPYFDKNWCGMRFLDGHIHYVIRNLLDAGYYIYYNGIDDYYVKGKTWYREKHFFHDGCICGYDQENKTYCIYAYDQNWIYRAFWISQKDFEAGRKALFKKEAYGYICGLKPKDDLVAFSLETSMKKISEYLDSTMENYPETAKGMVRGIVVHDYIAKYIDKLYDGSIPYEKMDRRVCRLIWEHKKVMLERITLIEKELRMDSNISSAYKTVIEDANNIRMLYASHHMKRRDSVLPIIKKKLLGIKEREQQLLQHLLQNTKGSTEK